MRLEVRGRVVRGSGEAASFTDLDWVREEFRHKLGFDPFSGTLNIQTTKEDAQAIYRLTKETGVPIDPPTEGFCVARCLRARVTALGAVPNQAQSAVQGAIIVPLVATYYEDIIEVMAPAKIMDALQLKDGQELSLEVWTDA